MDDEFRERIERETEKHALLSAVRHDSDADVGTIMGPLMGEDLNFRQHGGEIPGPVGPVVAEVNRLSAGEKRERPGELAPKGLVEMEAEEEADDSLPPDLPNVEAYDEVRMRATPSPSGPWHLGHVYMPAVIGTYKQMYDSSFIVRSDDTDSEMKRPDLMAYDAILDDIDYLGFEPDDVIRASDRVKMYHDYARKLIKMGGVYTCPCLGEESLNLKNDGKPCPHRDKDPETTREEFEDMVAGEHSSGEMALRVKIDIEHKNPAPCDWVAFRMIDTLHPRGEAVDYRVWSMLDSQSGVDDHFMGVVHIIHGIDLQDSVKRQQFIHDYSGWDYPEVVHWGYIQVDAYDVKIFTSSIKEHIDAGEAEGWNDPRVPTIKSLRRRGIYGQAIVDAMVGLGTSTSNVDLSMSTVYANSRNPVDDDTDRYFFVRDVAEGTSADSRAMSGPCEALAVEGGPDSVHPPLHPSSEERGTCDTPVGDSVFLESGDVPAEGEHVRPEGFDAVRREGDSLVVTGGDLDVVREGGVDVIHWAPTDGVPARMRTMDGDVTGVAEPDFGDVPEDGLVQSECIGFVRVGDRGDDETAVYFAHK